MNQKEKILGEERRELILSWLKASAQPLTGGSLAKRANVSRQVIVQDISILKARKHPILATSQGYLYLHERKDDTFVQRVIVCSHQPEEARDELTIIVDNGAIVKDVTVEHPVYGELTGSLLVRSRRDVNEFISKIRGTRASLLSELTAGIHLHTIEAESEEVLDEVCRSLKRAGYLVDSSL